MYFRLHPNANINAARIVAFLAQLDRQLAAPLVVIWDRLQAHRAIVVRRMPRRAAAGARRVPAAVCAGAQPGRYLWCYLKRNPLANLPIPEVRELADTARSHTRSIQRRPDLLKSFVRHSPLPLRLK